MGWSDAALREIFDAQDPAQARERMGSVLGRPRAAVLNAADLLEQVEKDALAFYRFPWAHWRKRRSTNPLERVNNEIGRRTDVVEFLPNDASALRLAGALRIEQSNE